MTELYKFTDGAQTLGFTPHFYQETLDGIVYLPTAVTRSALSLAGNLVKSQVTFTFPSDNEFARRRVFDLPGVGWFVEIIEDETVAWKGRIIGATLSGSKISILADSTERADMRNPTGARFGLNCWKTLYSTTCGANKALSGTAVAITAISGLEVTLSTSLLVNLYTGGILEKVKLNTLGQPEKTESRRIVGNINNTLTLVSPFESSAPGSAMLYLGCDLTSRDCLYKFNNIWNFGGFEFIPTKNPMERTGLL